MASDVDGSTNTMHHKIEFEDSSKEEEGERNREDKYVKHNYGILFFCKDWFVKTNR